MPFRFNEEAERGRQRAYDRFVGASLNTSLRGESRALLDGLIAKYGPVVECYPHWHPFMVAGKDRHSPDTLPSDRCGYEGLDHNLYLRNAIITCPYAGSETVIESVTRIGRHPGLNGVADVIAEEIDGKLYHESAIPILIRCEWAKPMKTDGTIPFAVALPLLLEKEVPCWRTAEVGESWTTMAPYILGQPYGSRSSLFVDQETGQALKATWNMLLRSGMYGPVKVRS